MSTRLLEALSRPLEALAATSPVEISEIPSRVDEIWQSAWSTSKRHGPEELDDKQVDLVKLVLEIVGRELVLHSIQSGTIPEPSAESSEEERAAFQQALQCRLDIALALFESAHASLSNTPVLEPGSLFLFMLEELVELISVESWRDLWVYIETRSKRFAKDMPASRGKALPFLRSVNAFLRFLPRTPEDLVFRGRIHQFASSVISIADKSAINLRGDYNEIKTIWEEEPVPPPKDEVTAGTDDIKEDSKGDADGDVVMSAETSKEEVKVDVKPGKEDKEDTKPEADFYSTLWSLQQYFAHPPSLAPSSSTSGSTPRTPEPTTTPFASFRQKSEIVLPILFEQTKKQKDLMGREVESGTKKRKRDEAGVGSEGAGDFFYPRYLTGKKLLEHELADPSFRRQILVQYFILFQFLLHLTPGTASKQAFTGGMPKNFVIEASDESWVRERVSLIREELRRMPPDGPRFEKTVLSIITRESHYAAWKNEGCPEGVFEVPPMDKGSAQERADLWKRRLAPTRRFRFNVGTMALSDMWRGGYSGIDQLRNWKRKSDVTSLYAEIEAIDADEDDDKAMGVEIPAEKLSHNEERRTSLTWRALRLKTKTDIRQLTALKDKRDLDILFKPQQARTKPQEAVVIAKAEPEVEAPKTPEPEPAPDVVPDTAAASMDEASAVAGDGDETETKAIKTEPEAESTAEAEAVAAAEPEAEGNEAVDTKMEVDQAVEADTQEGAQ